MQVMPDAVLSLSLYMHAILKCYWARTACHSDMHVLHTLGRRLPGASIALNKSLLGLCIFHYQRFSVTGTSDQHLCGDIQHPLRAGVGHGEQSTATVHLQQASSGYLLAFPKQRF